MSYSNELQEKARKKLNSAVQSLLIATMFFFIGIFFAFIAGIYATKQSFSLIAFPLTLAALMLGCAHVLFFSAMRRYHTARDELRSVNQLIFNARVQVDGIFEKLCSEREANMRLYLERLKSDSTNNEYA